MVEGDLRLDDRLVDDRGELVERLRARDEDAVDEEGGRAVHPEFVGQLEVGVDGLRPRVRLDPFLEARLVHAGGGRPALERVGERRATVSLCVEAKERVVAPEREDSLRGLGRRARVRMEGERQVFVDDTQIGRAVAVLQLVDRRGHLRAERALKVGELHDRDQGRPAAPRRIVAGDGDRGLALAGRVARRGLRRRCRGRRVGGGGGGEGRRLRAARGDPRSDWGEHEDGEEAGSRIHEERPFSACKPP